MSDSGKAVFLSYASQDAAVVRGVAEALRAAGIEVWFDQNELVGGDAWDAKIRGQIAACALFVPVISAATQARLEGYFRIEWKLAARRTHAMATAKAFLLPVVIDDTRDKEAHVPDEFREVQWTHLRQAYGGQARPGSTDSERQARDDVGLAAFCARVKKLLDGELGPRPSPAAFASERPGTVAVPGKTRRWIVAAAVGAAAVALALWQPWRKAGPNPPAVATAARVASSPEVQELLRQIWQIFEKNNDASREDWALAEEIGARAVKLENNNPDAWAAYSLVAVTSWFAGYDYTDAHFNDGMNRAERAMSLGPATIDARFAYANCLRMKPATRAEGERILRELVQQAPTDKRILRTLAATRRMQGNYDEALAWLERALALSGGDVAALMGKASVLQQLGRDAEAEGVLDQILAVRPSPYAFLWKAYFQVSLHGDLPQARATLEKIPASFLRKDDGAYLASRLALWLRDYDRSAAALRELTQDFLLNRFTVDPFLGEELRTFLTGQAHQLAGRKAAAEIDWRAGLRKIEQRLITEPSQPLWLFWKARLLAYLGEPDAEKTLEAFRQLAVADADTKFAAALVLVPLGRLDEAIDAVAESAREKSLAATTRKFWRLMLRHDPTFEPLRGNPRFDALVASLFPARAANAATRLDQESVAVLAFKNLSGDPAREFFSDGLSEAVTDVLGRVPGLKVVGSASAFSFKGKAVPIPEIARQLGVTHLVEGTVLQEGAMVRITAKLIQADGFQVWGSDKLDRELKNIFALHDEVAGLIAKNLSLKLGASSAASTAAVNPQAFEVYIQGRQAWGLRTTEGFAQAERLLNHALELEPNFARAHAALADVWTTRAGAEGSLGLFRLRGGAIIQKSTAAARRAIDLDPNLAEAHAALGNVAWNDWQIAEAIPALRTAVTLNSNYASAHQFLGRVLATDGQMEQALAALRRAHELEPLAHKIADNLSIVLFSAGRHTEALALADHALALQPSSIWAQCVRGWALAELGHADAAVAAVRRVSGETPATWKANAAYALARAGARSEAQAMLARIEPADRSANAAAALLVLNQNDECWRALEEGSRNILSADALLYWRVFDSIRGEARFQRMLATLGLSEAHARAQAWRAAHPPEKREAKP